MSLKKITIRLRTSVCIRSLVKKKNLGKETETETTHPRGYTCKQVQKSWWLAIYPHFDVWPDSNLVLILYKPFLRHDTKNTSHTPLLYYLVHIENVQFIKTSIFNCSEMYKTTFTFYCYKNVIHNHINKATLVVLLRVLYLLLYFKSPAAIQYWQVNCKV